MSRRSRILRIATEYLDGEKPFLVAVQSDRISFAGRNGAGAIRLAPGEGSTELVILYEQPGTLGARPAFELLRGPTGQVSGQFDELVRDIRPRSHMSSWAIAACVIAFALASIGIWEAGKHGLFLLHEHDAHHIDPVHTDADVAAKPSQTNGKMPVTPSAKGRDR